ncbi:MAG: hypothetical protein PHX18_05440 [Candidatus Gastranaerophilales bacterium]|nr:hypothetical protein [Candidatus Gastranaerophilales bacterium]
MLSEANTPQAIESFAQNLATQAKDAFPQDLPQEVQQFISNTIYEFVKMAAEALSGDTNTNYSDEQAVFICQSIGEWMFHKGIDNYRNSIASEDWANVLQQIASVVFEVAKEITTGIDTQELVGKIEQYVQQTYKNILEQLALAGKLQKSVEEASSQSNLNEYIEQINHDRVMSPQEEERELRFMTMAMYFKSLPPDKVEKMVTALSADDKKHILTYMTMDNLEQMVDPVLYSQYLEKFHNSIPNAENKKKKKITFANLKSLLQETTPQKIAQITAYERENVKNFLIRLQNGRINPDEEDVFSPQVLELITKHLIQKVQ